MSDHDPFAPADPNPSTKLERRASAAAYAEFPEERWRRAGAKDKDVTDLRAAWDEASPEQRAADGQRIAGASNTALKAELKAFRETGEAAAPFGRTVEEIKDNVGEDPERAQAALEIEQGREEPRKTLVAHLESVIAAGTSAE